VVLAAGRPMVCTLQWLSVLPQMPGLVICTSQQVYDQQVPNEDRRILITNGIDTSRFSSSSGRQHGQRVIRVCRPEKCAEYFWPAMFEVLEACPDASLTVVGGSPYQVGRIQSVGYRFDVETLLSESDIFAYAPRPHEGAFDLVVMEAMASGLPCVLSDVACVNEAVEHEITGFLVPYGDVKAFSSSLQALLNNLELRGSMGEQAANVAREKFDVRDRIPLYSLAYARAMEESILPSQAPAWRQKYLEWLTAR
jgi:glycosyltransferase involved in cell wall biosynthesis